MSNLNKLDFTTLEVSGRNYLKWVQDGKLHFTVKNLHPIIEDKMDNSVDESGKATAMIFIRRHIHDALQTDLSNPITSHCNENLTEKDLLEETYLSFSTTNIVLQQQYRAQKFTEFLDLIFALLFAEK
ncbi:uncharacterized protein [Malus domestica]|uniref:uncharacterized protein n=1 Tax=Malus domestica TaxID=3750 RepID=UPI0039770320